MKIIAYTYDADVHCPTCTAARFAHTAAKGFHVEHNSNPVGKSYGKPGTFTSYHTDIESALDERLIPIDQVDREGNPVRPVFDIDEDPDGTFTHCGDCREELT